MSPADDEMGSLRRDVQYLKDRMEILDCVQAQARGHDRHDADLLTSVYHEDGWDEHGIFVNAGPDYAGWANETHTRGSQANMHHITTHSCTIDGDTAHADSYVIGAMLDHDGVTARLLCGRYIDRLERRDGVWRIAVRRCTVEVAGVIDASLLSSRYFRDMHFAKGARDRSDLAYSRPLTLDTPAPGTW